MLRDHIFSNPLSLAAGLAIWVPIGIWVVALVQWAVQGDVDVLSAIAGIAAGIGLGGTALLARDPYMAPLILVAVVVTMIAFPVVRSSLNRRALNQIDVEAIERAYEMLAQTPGNASAKFKLAKTIYNKGMPAHALALAEDAIQNMPAALFQEENNILKKWRYYRIAPEQNVPLACLECGVKNHPGLTHCQRCGAPFLLDHARGAWVGKGLARKFVAAWVAIIVALVGIPFVAGSLPAGAAIPVIIGLMALAIFVLAATFRSSGAPAR